MTEDESKDISGKMDSVNLCVDGNGEVPIQGVQIKHLQVRPSARIIKHPIETGGVVMDNKVLDPRMINLKVVVTWKEDGSHKAVLQQLDEIWEDRFYQFCSVTTREGKVYKNLKMVTEPHTETPDRFNVFEFDLQFEEMMFGTKQDNQPADADNTDTKAKGQIQGS